MHYIKSNDWIGRKFSLILLFIRKSAKDDIIKAHRVRRESLSVVIAETSICIAQVFP